MLYATFNVLQGQRRGCSEQGSMQQSSKTFKEGRVTGQTAAPGQPSSERSLAVLLLNSMRREEAAEVQETEMSGRLL